MHASKVSVDSTKLGSPLLKGKRKTALRRKIILEYIAERPAGSIVRSHEFQTIGRFTGRSNAMGFVKNMIRDGLIARTPGSVPMTYSYAVLTGVRTRRPAASRGGASSGTRLPADVERAAKEWSWDTGSDSLREFVKYMKEA